MPFETINKLPAGLLGFLGVKNGGRYPQDLNLTLQPTWDLQEQYFVANCELFQQTVSVATGTNSYPAAIGPTQSEYWVVQDYSGRITLQAADTSIELALGYEFQGTPLGPFMALQNLTGTYATGGAAKGVSVVADRKWFVLPPGSLLSITANAVIAANRNLDLRARICRMPA